MKVWHLDGRNVTKRIVVRVLKIKNKAKRVLLLKGPTIQLMRVRRGWGGGGGERWGLGEVNGA